MFADLLSLFSGWYEDYVSQISLLISQTSSVIDPSSGDVITTTVLPEVWSAFVPWEALIAAVVLITFICCIFKFLRAMLCKM